MPLPTRAVAMLLAAATASFPRVLYAQAAPPELDPAAPLAPLPDLGVPWPDLAAPTSGAPPVAAEAGQLRRYRIVVAGDNAIPGFRATFDQLSALRTGEGKPANAAQIDRRARQDEALADALLRAAGRYDATVSTNVDSAGGGDIQVRMAVDAGPAYTLREVATPGLETAGPRAAALARDLAVKPGDPLDATHVQAAVAGFRAALGREGYAFAKVADPRIEVDHATRTATLVLPVTLGQAARFGRIVATGRRPVFSARHLGDIARFKSGDPYDAALLDDFRRALIATSLVSVATVSPQSTTDPATVDIAVHTERAPPRTIAGEFGYGTGEGARAEVSWQHRNLLPPEGAVTFRGVLGTREQALGAILRRSNWHARDRVLTAQLAANHSNLNAYDAKTLTLGLGLERQTNIIWQKKWSWSLGTEFLASDERDTIQATGQGRRRTYIVAALPGTLAYDGSDDLLNPTRGFRLSGRLSPEANLRRGARGYVKAQVDASAYLPVGRGTSLAGRVRFAAINGAKRDEIAPSRRLYAGGGGSVRGFGYQKIGPVDVDRDPVGGRGLFEAAIEARVRFGNFGVVPFLDAGSLSQRTHPTFDDVRFGTGLGVRYYSTFGPIRVDVGTPIARRRGESRVALYVSLGQAF